MSIRSLGGGGLGRGGVRLDEASRQGRGQCVAVAEFSFLVAVVYIIVLFIFIVSESDKEKESCTAAAGAGVGVAGERHVRRNSTRRVRAVSCEAAIYEFWGVKSREPSSY